MGHRAQVGTRAVALLAILALAACPSKAHKATGVGVPLKFARGGVVRAGMLTDDLGQSGPGQPVLDPSREYSYEGFEILRCCLTRTLYSYNGHPTSEGGA